MNAVQLVVQMVRDDEVTVPGASKFGKFYTFPEHFPQELEQLETLTSLIIDYVANRTPPRPLCLAVFGPPGSGKSFAVNEICAQAKEVIKKQNKNVKLPMITVNMTQAGSAVAVGRVLARIAGEQNDDTIPILFIDEFDASRDGAAYGWLSWFLGPMNDGKFLHEGATVHLKRAIYVFAGGTADTMEAFSAQASPGFREAKGPDFISRLRGYLDVKGPNDAPREFRRALILGPALRKLLNKHPEGSKLTVDPVWVESLLSGVGRYRHGARSISAVVEMSSVPDDATMLSWNLLPHRHLLKLHVDRGPLDAERIDGCIALSGYTSDNEPALKCGIAVAEALWDEGATLAHVWVPKKESDANDDLMTALIGKLRTRPVEPSRDPEDRGRPAPRLWGYMSSDMTLQLADEAISLQDRVRCGLYGLPQEPIGESEREELNNEPWRISLLSIFRRRFAMSEASVARFAIGGWTSKHGSRIPGVAEEVMLTLAFQRPVYIAGGFDGAAAELGHLLGLSDVRKHGSTASFAPYANDDALESVAGKLQPAPLCHLPVKSTQMVRFLKAHAFGSRRWPYNGLSRSENRDLFASTEPAEIARLVVRGLRNYATSGQFTRRA